MADFVKVDEWLSRQLDRLNLPRMPWNDVHTMFRGPAVMDLCQHFVERWNFVRGLKCECASSHINDLQALTRDADRHDSRYHLLAFPHDDDDDTSALVKKHPHYEKFKEGIRHVMQKQPPPEGNPHG